MDPWGVFFLCLCFMTAQSETMEASQEPLHWMKKLERMVRSRSSISLPGLIRDLECSLLNASFGGSNLTLQTPNIQALIFKLGCNFAGLSLNSTTMKRVPQAWVPHAMQFPAELTQDACRTRPRELRLICIYFFTDHFFQNTNSSLLNNYVLGAQLGRGHVNNLRDPVNISFWHNRSLEGYTATCVFWKEGASKDYWGAWSSEGCRTEQPSPSQVLCRCNHLSYFAVLMQLSPAPIPEELLAPLTYISLVGCSISMVASLLTLLLHFQARQQGDSITRIHMNLHASVLLLNVTFLLSPSLALPSTSETAACKALAAIMHFALLSCLTWMAIEGFNLYLLLGRVYNIYIHRYLLKLCAVGWVATAMRAARHPCQCSPLLSAPLFLSPILPPTPHLLHLQHLHHHHFQHFHHHLVYLQHHHRLYCHLHRNSNTIINATTTSNFYLQLHHHHHHHLHHHHHPHLHHNLCATFMGVPALLVLLLLVTQHSVYGPHTIPLSNSQGNDTAFRNVSICWVRDPWVHNILVMGYGGLTSVFNLVVLVWALRLLHQLRAREEVQSPRACRDSVTVLGLTVLLGTTWALAFFSFGVFLLPQLFLFTTFNSLYGFFLFLWFCSQRYHAEAEAEAEMEAFSSSQTMK
ncbi:adhesion G-protein coupled receptor G5 isoform X1 [Canis aureus]|uniref:Adhesion G protein-coupled receptor G5 n=1 Tax=Canis lupus familiaris TaxID=9615 RepID=A0A8C0RBA6_CANLF